MGLANTVIRVMHTHCADFVMALAEKPPPSPFFFNVYLSLLIFGCVLCLFSLLILCCVLCRTHFYYRCRQLPFDSLFLITAFLPTDLPSLQIAIRTAYLFFSVFGFFFFLIADF